MAIVLADGGRRRPDPAPRARPRPRRRRPRPSEPQVTATVRVAGYRPNGLVMAGGNVWLSSFKRPRRLGRVDPPTRRSPGSTGRGPSVGVGRRRASRAGSAPRGAGLSRQQAGRAAGPGDRRPARRRRTSRPSPQPTSVETGRGSLWVAELTPTPEAAMGTCCARLDPRSGAAEFGGGIAVHGGIRTLRRVTERAIWIVAPPRPDSC